MEQLKRELLLLCRERDTGRPDLQGEWVSEFFNALTQFLTVQAIDTFDVEQLRTLYVSFMYEVKTASLDEARKSIVLFIHCLPKRRRMVVETPSAPNVKKLFPR
ncbi:hypothetical protein [Pseudomonas sp.]|uniref:hypothetical protein n=1 Tax=Pseudomonas sp. TaxID=306 RepID=UPI003FD8A474